MRLFLLPGIAAAAAALTPHASAQQASARCNDDRGLDRCAPAQQAQMRALYRLPPIEELAAQGPEVRRIFFVNGYGGDVIALSFTRSPGEDPAVTVHYPGAGDRRRAPLRAPLPTQAWTQVLRSSLHFDRALVPVASADLNICMHSWVYVVEAAEPARDNRPAVLRRAVGNACANDLASVFAGEAAEIALPLFPHCAALDPDLHRNAATRLAACSILSGDRLAAAEAMNALSPLRGINHPYDVGRARSAFAEDATLDWGGTRTAGQPAFEAFAAEMLGPPLTFLDVTRIHGETADRVLVEGRLSRRIDDQRLTAAPVSLLFTRRHGFGMRVESVAAGTFGPVSSAAR